MEPWDLPPPSGAPTAPSATATDDDEATGSIDDRRRRRGGGGDEDEADVAEGDLIHRARSNGIISDIEDPSASRGTNDDALNPGNDGTSVQDGAPTAVASQQQTEGDDVAAGLLPSGGDETTITTGGDGADDTRLEALTSLEASTVATSIDDRMPVPPAAAAASAASAAVDESTFLDWPQQQQHANQQHQQSHPARHHASGHHRERRRGDRKPPSHQELLRRQAAVATAAAASEAASPNALHSGTTNVPSWEGRRRPPQARSPARSYGRGASIDAGRASSVPTLGVVPSASSSSTRSIPQRQPVRQEQPRPQRRRQHEADSFESDPYCAPPSSGAMTSSSNIPMPGWSVVETTTSTTTAEHQPSSSSPTRRTQVQVPVVDELGNELVPPPPAVPAAASPGGMPPCQRSLHSAAVLDGIMYVFGGYDGQARVNDFYAFSFGEMRWYPVVPAVTSGPPPSPRDRHISIAYRNTFYIFGGFDGRARVSDFYGFNVNSMTWQEIIHLSGSPPSPRHSHAAVVFHDSMYVFGGYDGSYRSDLNEYDFLTSSWKTVQASGRPPRARYRATCVVHNNLMILFGGHDGTRHLADAHVFDFETRVWSGLVTEGAPPLPRDSHVSVMHGDCMYVFGGSTGSAMNDLHELRFPSGGGDSNVAKWSPIMSASDANIPRHRFCHVGVVYCDSMFVFGGYDGSSRLNDFIRFDFGVGNTTCEVQPSSLISDLRSFVNNEELSDITFIVEGQHVHAHKFMLVRSSYFRAMFLGEMREATQPTIPLEHVSLPVFLLLLEYLYTDEVNVSLEFAMELFAAADEFCVPRLKAMCEKQMLASITVENAASLFLASDLHSADSLKRKTLNFILGNFEQVSKTSTFEEMARTNVELVFEILRNR